jgi:hypothetical protein
MSSGAWIHGWIICLKCRVGSGGPAIFQLNIHLYPESANTYDSLGEMYAFLGDKDLAITNYQRSIELDPGNTNAVEKLRK